MTRFILIRHGQSLANSRNLFAGHSDFDLSELGHQQAVLAANYLKKREHVDAVYASDLLRAYHTALPIAEAFGLPVIPDPALREIYAGEWESLSFTEIAARYPDAFDVWCHHYSLARPTGGESTAEVYRRIVPHICSLAEEHDGKCLVLATHATVVRAFESFARGYSAEETGKIDFFHNAAFGIYTYERGKVTALRSDITEHLGDSVTGLPSVINA